MKLQGNNHSDDEVLYIFSAGREWNKMIIQLMDITAKALLFQSTGHSKWRAIHSDNKK